MEDNHTPQNLLYIILGVISWLFSEQGIIVLDAILKIVSITSFVILIVVNFPRFVNTFKRKP